MAINSLSTGFRPGVCTSSTRPTAPYEGQQIYETDTDRMYVWNGSAWVIPNQTTQNPTGLEYVGSSSFTAISSGSPLNLDGLFSSTYDNYRIEIEWIQNTSNGDFTLKFRDSGGAVSTNYAFATYGSYMSSGVFQYTGFNSSANQTQTSAYVMGVVAGTRGVACHDIFSPNLARETNMTGQVSVDAASATLTRVQVSSFIRQNSSTVFVGVQLSTTAGTATGTIRVYGYRNS